MSWAFAKVLLNFFILVCWSWLPAEWPPSFWKKNGDPVTPLFLTASSNFCSSVTNGNKFFLRSCFRFHILQIQKRLCSIPILVWADEFSGLFSVYFSRKVVVSQSNTVIMCRYFFEICLIVREKNFLSELYYLFLITLLIIFDISYIHISHSRIEKIREGTWEGYFWKYLLLQNECFVVEIYY